MPKVSFHKETDKQNASTIEGALTFVPDNGIYLGDGTKAIPIVDNEPGYYTNLKRIKKYLYEATYNYLNYDKAFQFYKNLRSSQPQGACSAFVENEMLCRNFDWNYSNQVTFMIYTPATLNRYSSFCVSSGFPALSSDLVASRENNDLYRLVPFQISDGMNDCGLAMEMNVIPVDNGYNKAIPTLEPQVECCALMLIRFILDNFCDIDEAIDYMQKHMIIYYPKSLHDQEYELHYLITNGKKTYVLEIQNNKLIAIPHNMSTNFIIDKVEFNADGSVNTPASIGRPSENKITRYGSGLERYNIINESIGSIGSLASARNLLNKLLYTNSYKTTTEPFWYSEYVGAGLTVDVTPAELQDRVERVIQDYESRSRDNPITWHSMHSVIYDIPNRTIHLWSQEQDFEYVRSLESNTVTHYRSGLMSYKDKIRLDELKNTLFEISDDTLQIFYDK